MASNIFKDKERGTYYVEKHYKKHYIKKRGFATITEAKTYLNNQMYLIDHPDEVKKDLQDILTLNDVWELYLKEETLKIRQTTLSWKVYRYSDFIAPKFGDIPIYKIEPNKIMEWKQELVKKEYSKGFTNDVIRQFRMLFEYAERNEISINHKCVAILDNVKVNKISKEKQILTYDEIDKFLNTFDKSNKRDLLFYQYFYAFSRSGMRPNEFRGLQVKNIKDNGLQVDHDITSFVDVGTSNIIQNCKNENSVRFVQMPKDIMNMIKEITKDYEPDDFIFGKEKPFCETTLKTELKKHCALAGVPQIALYGFRHSHATHLIRNGILIKVVSKRLGHKNVTTTLNVYQHLLQEDEESVIKLFEK